jgi:hypothetical protein
LSTLLEHHALWPVRCQNRTGGRVQKCAHAPNHALASKRQARLEGPGDIVVAAPGEVRPGARSDRECFAEPLSLAALVMSPSLTADGLIRARRGQLLNPMNVKQPSDRVWRLASAARSRHAPHHLILIASLAITAASGCSSSPSSPTAVSGGVSALSLSVSSAVPGVAVTGTITLSKVAPTGGASVTVTSSDSAATVPTIVSVPAGATTQTFELETVDTSSSTTTTVTITATYGGVSKTATLSVGRPILQSLSLSTDAVACGTILTGKVTLTLTAPTGGLPIALASNSPFVFVPASVTVAEGSTSQTFEIETIDTPSAITTTVTAAYADVTLNATLSIENERLESLIGIPAQVPGGISFQGKVTVSKPAPANGISVVIASSNPAVAVPAVATVAAGATTGAFDIVTANLPATVTTTISATYAGVTRSATLTVVPHPDISAVSCSPSSPVGGALVECTGTLVSPAPATGWLLSLESSDSSFGLPSTLSTPAGTSTFHFTVATTPVSSAEWVTIQINDAPSGLSLFRFTMYVAVS